MAREKKLNRWYHSIRFRFPMITVLVLTLVIGALIFVNATYLETFTIAKKIRTLEEIHPLITGYVEGDYSDEDLVELEKMARRTNLEMVIVKNLDSIPQVVYASDFNENGKCAKMLSYFYGDLPLAQEIYVERDSYLIYKAFNNRLGSSQIDCIGVVGKNVGFVLSTPLESIQDTVQLSTGFLLVVGLLATLIGGIIMFFVTATLTRPIRQLSSLSTEMAELNFDVSYEGKRKGEIQTLGESMNRMSEKLENAINELRMANVQLEKDLKEKERIDEMRRQFLSNVSHELKTPIALIQGYSEGLKEGVIDDPESMEFYCDVIIDEAQKMNTIVRRLLNLDEIENGNVKLEITTFDLAELTADVARSSKMLAEEKNCRLELNLLPDAYVKADEFMIEQVVQNYMSNAYHYVDDGGTVTVRMVRYDEKICTYVRNTGSCIPEEDLEHLWEKFYKVDKARTRAYGGSGIGLSIVKAVMNSHGGACGVRNTSDGVEFWFTLDSAGPETEENSAEM